MLDLVSSQFSSQNIQKYCCKRNVKQTTDDDNVYSDIDDDPMSREADDLLSRAQRNSFKILLLVIPVQLLHRKC